MKDIKEIVTSTQSTMKLMIAIGVTTVGVLLGILATFWNNKISGQLAFARDLYAIAKSCRM